MKKVVRNFGLVLVMVSFMGGISLAKDLNKMVEGFYAGLADIIEANMDNPEICLVKVEDYYQKNQAVINEIRQETAKALEKSAPMMQKKVDEYMSMSEEELEALERKHGGEMAGKESDKSPIMTRYSQALGKFSLKYPEQGMQIGLKAMELMPASESGSQ